MDCTPLSLCEPLRGMFDRCENVGLGCESSSHQLSSTPTTEPDPLLTLGADVDYLARKIQECEPRSKLTLSGEMVTAIPLVDQEGPEPIPDNSGSSSALGSILLLSSVAPLWVAKAAWTSSTTAKSIAPLSGPTDQLKTAEMRQVSRSSPRDRHAGPAVIEIRWHSCSTYLELEDGAGDQSPMRLGKVAFNNPEVWYVPKNDKRKTREVRAWFRGGRHVADQRDF